MNDESYYERCAIAALQALIAKTPLFDKEKGDDSDAIGLDIAKSADRYASDMVRIKNERKNKHIEPPVGTTHYVIYDTGIKYYKMYNEIELDFYYFSNIDKCWMPSPIPYSENKFIPIEKLENV